MKEIWVLFSIANDYNQPESNLEGWWSEKPTFRMLADFFGINVDLRKENRQIGQLFEGKEVILFRSAFRLEKIKEGKYEYERD